MEYNEAATIRVYEIVLSALVQEGALHNLLQQQKEVLLTNQKTIWLLLVPSGQ